MCLAVHLRRLEPSIFAIASGASWICLLGQQPPSSPHLAGWAPHPAKGPHRPGQATCLASLLGWGWAQGLNLLSLRSCHAPVCVQSFVPAVRPLMVLPAGFIQPRQAPHARGTSGMGQHWVSLEPLGVRPMAAPETLAQTWAGRGLVTHQSQGVQPPPIPPPTPPPMLPSAQQGK